VLLVVPLLLMMRLLLLRVQATGSCTGDPVLDAPFAGTPETPSGSGRSSRAWTAHTACPLLV